MRTRSSRFFMVLLHLVGVRRHSWLSYYPSSEWWWSIQPQTTTTSTSIHTTLSNNNNRKNHTHKNKKKRSIRSMIRSGIMGVQPYQIRMELLDLAQTGQIQQQHQQQYQNDNVGSEDRNPSTSQEVKEMENVMNFQFSMDPIWLQDSTTSIGVGTRKCLGPTGYFSECGDATLWSIRPTKRVVLGDQNNERTTSAANTKKKKNRIRTIIRKARRWILANIDKSNNLNDNSEHKDERTTLVDQDNRQQQQNDTDSGTTVVGIGWVFQVSEDTFSRGIVHESLPSRSPTPNNYRRRKKVDENNSMVEECLQYDLQNQTVDVQRCEHNRSRRRKRWWWWWWSRKFRDPNQQQLDSTDHDDEDTYLDLGRTDRDHCIGKSIWIVTQDGFLQTIPQVTKKRSKRFRLDNDDDVRSSPQQHNQCLGRNIHTHQAFLLPCSTNSNNNNNTNANSKTSSDGTHHDSYGMKQKQQDEQEAMQYEPVRFSFIRYLSVPLPSGVDNTDHENEHINHNYKKSEKRSELSYPSKLLDGTDNRQVFNDGESLSRTDDSHSSIQGQTPLSNLPSNRDMAAIRSNAHTIHPGLSLSTHIRFDSIPTQNAHNFLSNSHPILFTMTPAVASSSLQASNNIDDNTNQHHVTSRLGNDRLRMVGVNIREISQHDDTGTTTNESISHVVVDTGKFSHPRIFRNPYIDASKDNIWTDPSTGLEYHTDLCEYLGWNRNEKGRQTLTGMGIYRKGYVIKVYGIAYYASNRDVLADPAFKPYSGMSSDQLRKIPDFYKLLSTMGPGSSRFDRTIMLKTNMQLSAETMRSSLQADWSYLTDEMKTTLVGSSMEARPADENMLKLIQSSDNPSRCSCSQVAPSEYNANPECCARGTELAFTWLKTDELEVRLNGKLMISFPRPDIAAGIFFEYLRYDDPIAPELLDRVVEGFPFLLSPLTQVKGVNMAGLGKESSPDPVPDRAKFHFDPWAFAVNTAGGVFDSMNHQASVFTSTTKRTLIDPTGNMARAAFEYSKKMMKAADEKRATLVSHATGLQGFAVRIMQRDEESIRAFTEFGGSILRNADQSREWILSSVVWLPSTIVKAVQRDKETLQQMSDFASTISKMFFFASGMEESEATFDASTTTLKVENIIIPSEHRHRKRARNLRAFMGNILSRWFREDEFLLLHDALDEIGPMKVYPTMDITRRIFLTLGHLYLLLIFIVSFPGSYSSGTKSILIRKTHVVSSHSDSESESMSDGRSSWHDDDDIYDNQSIHLFPPISHGTLKRKLQQKHGKHAPLSAIQATTASSVTSTSTSARHLQEHNLFSRAAQEVLASARRRNRKSTNNVDNKDVGCSESTSKHQRESGSKTKSAICSDSSVNPLKKKSLSYFL